MHPVLLKIGSFELASYGLMTALGYAAAALYLLPRLKKINLDKDTFWNLIFIAFMGALIGAKLLFIIVSWPQLGATLADKIANIVRDFRYGFVFFGGMIVSVFSLIFYMKKKGLPVLKTSDFLITGLPLGHALGRVGCFLAGCCYGRPTDMPWGVTFTDPHALVAPELVGVPLHPTQLYEAAGNLILFFILHKLYNKPHKNGMILLAYVSCYALMRFIIEFFRGDFRGEYILGLSPSQLISLLTAMAAGAVWIYLKKKEVKNG
ncbi:MAG: prolipoprotein diacylglyceryl transferase [Elusimicrobia bacterium]|nr:prolipoprotein diacylglyceryl transferase [Elusimicrobiota bacterium]MDD7578062.1 prolipoprotein diacylglyceryl transferase [Elusimicrobiota bacterium]MDY6038897.1 prolipoprotein diacylglyceryl transferase [Elusimicrobiaceae bacterium]